MAHKSFLIHYSSGISRYVTREERDGLMYLHGLKQTGPREYSCQLQVIKCHQLSDLEPMRKSAETEIAGGPRYIGSWIFQLGDERIKENEESETGMVIRVRKQMECAA